MPRLQAPRAHWRDTSRKTETKNFQPVNITFALLEPLSEQDRKRVRGKRDRHQLQIELALKEWDTWLHETFDAQPAATASRMNRLRLIVACFALVLHFWVSRLHHGLLLNQAELKRRIRSHPRPTSRPGQDSERSTTPARSKPSANRQRHKNQRLSDEVDEHDIVRFRSNLVPIPASVVDAGGNAITGLKLEDFELRVDGQLRPISEMTRADTSVKLVMLFDNSGSVSLSREFEKQAAKRFFRKVLRPSDEAAIYSIESDSYLAQPLTKDLAKTRIYD